MPLLHPSQSFSQIYTELSFISCAVFFDCNAAMFLFRLAQSVDSPKVALFSDPKYGFGIAAALTAASSIILVLCADFLWMSEEKIKASIGNDHPVLYALIKDQPIVGFEVNAETIVFSGPGPFGLCR